MAGDDDNPPDQPQSPDTRDDQNANKLNKLIRCRGGHRAWVSARLREADNLLSNQELTEEDKDKLFVLKETLIERNQLLRDLNQEIQDETQLQDLEEEIADSSNRETDIKLIIRRIAKLEVSIPEIPADNGQQQRTVYQNAAYLPKINIAKYDGDPKNWQCFWDLFSGTVDQNPSLSVIQKVAYLKSLCTGVAASAISGIRNTVDQYEVMVETLKNRFDKKSFVRDTHLNDLLNLERVNDPNATTKLRDLYNTINNHLSALNSVGLQCDKEALLAPILIKTLPEKVQDAITTEYGDSEITVHAIMNSLLNYVESKERFQSITNSKNGTKKKVFSKNQSDVHKQQSFQFHTSSTAKVSASRPYRCPYCEKSAHPAAKCPNVAKRSDRLRIIREKRLCFNCLRQNHQARYCSWKSNCFSCDGRHHSSICEWGEPWRKEPHPSFPSQQQQQQQASRFETPGDSSHSPQSPGPSPSGYTSPAAQQSAPTYGNPHVTNFAQSKIHKPHIFLQTAVADVVNPVTQKTIRIRLLFDEGSMHSYVSADLAKFLQLPIIGEEYCQIQTFGSSVSKTVLTNTVQLQLKKGDFQFHTNMYTSDYICQPVPNVHLSKDAVNELSSINLADPFILSESELPVSMLIGCDIYWQFILPEMFQTNAGPMAVQSKLGYLLSGPVHFTISPAYLNILTSPVNFISHVALAENFTAPNEHEINFKLEQFFKLDSLGILPQEATIMEEFETSVEYFPEQKRYRVHLPWKDSMRIRLPSYRSVAEKRLDSLCKKLNKIEKNPENEVESNIIERYQSVIDDQLNKGIIVKVDNDDYNDDKCLPDVKCFLPHRCVLKPDSSTSPVRIVLDGSAKYKGATGSPSLNDCLMAGPSLIIDLCKLLVQFRLNPVALVCDIEKAYLNLELHPNDQSAVMFLWRKNADQSEPILTFKFTKVPFGLTSSPFLLMAALNFHFQKFEKSYPVANKIKDKFYMDDAIISTKSPENAISLHKSANELMALASMNLRKWNSNSPEVREYLMYNSSEELPNHQKVLGLNWDVLCDTLSCVVKPVLELARSVCPSKRNILSVVASIFDPMGILSCFMLQPKQIFQLLCKNKINWDETLPNSIIILWQNWVTSLESLIDLKLERYIFQNILFEEMGPQSIEIHTFCDASLQGYCTVIYLRVKDKLGNFHVKFLMSKSRIAPLKKLTLPRLELLAALLAVRLTATAIKFLAEFNISQIMYYSDSMNVLHWIKAPSKTWGVFIMHRLREIRSLSSESQWFYVPSSSNPADVATRYNVVINSQLRALWFDGPDFIRNDIELNVPEIDVSITPECILTEEKQIHCVNLITEQCKTPNISNCIDINKYSSYRKLINVTFHVLKAVKLFKKSEFDFAELKSNAEVLWIQAIQLSYFPVECKYASRNANVKIPACEKTVTPVIKQLGLFMDENCILRCRTRLSQHTGLKYDTKYPIYLPKKCYFTKLIILDRHINLFHSGVSHTLNQIRQEYWIPTGRREVRNVLSGCLTCLKLKASPYISPIAPPLPQFRLSEETPFSYVFVDFMGPIYVKCYDVKKPLKSYVAVFTCAVTRGVKLEIVTNLTVSSFLLALRRFVSACGKPKLIVSDNARTFKSTAKELAVLLSPKVIQKFCLAHRITWRFNVPLAPWWGGAVERIVGLVKNALRSTMSRALLTYEEVHTTLAEVEICLNSRPLNFVSDELNENTAITPSTLMRGSPMSCFPPISLVDAETIPRESQFSSKRLKYLERLQNDFWTRFSKEYLNYLSEAHFVARNRGGTPSKFPEIDDIVLLKENNKPRYTWKLGRVINTHPGRDGAIRSIEIRPVRLNASDKRIPDVIRRAPSMCVPLEFNIPEKPV